MNVIVSAIVHTQYYVHISRMVLFLFLKAAYFFNPSPSFPVDIALWVALSLSLTHSLTACKHTLFPSLCLSLSL